MSSVNMRFGKQLKKYRNARKLNQIEFGKILSYSQAEVSKIENGKIDITMNQYFHIVKALETNTYLNYLLLITRFNIEFLLIFKHKII